MRKSLIALFMVLSMYAFAQNMPSVFITPYAGDKIEVTAGTTSSIAILTDHARFSLQGDDRDRFIKFLDLHIGLINDATKLGLFDNSTPVAWYRVSPNLTIQTSLVAKNSELYVSMYINYMGVNSAITMTQSNLQEFKTAIQSALSYNGKRADSESALQKLITELVKTFG